MEKEKPKPHAHKSRVTRVLISDWTINGRNSAETLYWKVTCPVCGDLSLHLTWNRAIIKASDHPELWDFAEKERKKLYSPKNEISDRFEPR